MAENRLTKPGVDEEGWMRRCILLAAPRQADAWRSALAAAASRQGRYLVFLDQEPAASEVGDADRIFVASDRRFLRPSPDAQRIALMQGLTHFTGLDAVSEEDARVHLIEMSRFAVEAIDWSDDARGRVLEAHGSLSLFDDFSVSTPDLPSPVEGVRDRTAREALSYLSSNGRSRWDPSLFITNTRPIDEAAKCGWLDMTGPPRALIRGPYLWARPGRWAVKARFMLDEDGAGQELQIRWGPPLAPVILMATPARAGVFEVELENEWTAADGMELTIALPHSSVSGQLALVTVELTRCG